MQKPLRYGQAESKTENPPNQHGSESNMQQLAEHTHTESSMANEQDQSSESDMQ